MIPRLLNRLFRPRPITHSEWLAGMRALDQAHPLPGPRFLSEFAASRGTTNWGMRKRRVKAQESNLKVMRRAGK